MIRREIGKTPYHDGHLPWPYTSISEGEVHSLAGLYPDLVSITGVILPPQKAEPAASPILQPFKPHFIFTHQLPQAPLSKKTLSNLEIGRASWAFAKSEATEDWSAFQVLYRELVHRRGLELTSFNFTDAHFSSLRQLPYVTLYGVRDSMGWGAMLCAARFGDELHLIHIVVSASGLRTNASYVMMQGMIDHCREQQLSLFIGGVPSGDDGGMLRFKKRWTNQTQMSYLVRLIVRPDVYDKLSLPDNAFFPSYRRAWTI